MCIRDRSYLEKGETFSNLWLLLVLSTSSLTLSNYTYKIFCIGVLIPNILLHHNSLKGGISYHRGSLPNRQAYAYHLCQTGLDRYIDFQVRLWIYQNNREYAGVLYMVGLILWNLKN